MINNLNLNLVELGALADQAAVGAGELLRNMWDQPREIKSKGYRDLVTDADYAAQEYITNIVNDRFDDHGFLTEENDPDLRQTGPVLWVIDPLDGTSNYSRHIPTFCVSIAALSLETFSGSDSKSNDKSDFQVLAGAIYDPMRQELFSAVFGQGSKLNEKTVQVSQTTDLASCSVGLDWSRSFDKRKIMLESVGRFAHEVNTIRATGSAALALAWVAAGRLDVYANLGIGPWDVAAAKLIIEEAGGRVSNILGNPWQLTDAGCVVSNSFLHQGFLDLAGLDQTI